MKLTSLMTHICNAFSQIKQLACKMISKMSGIGKIAAAIGLISGIITTFVFLTGKNLPDIFHSAVPATTLEDSTTEGKSNKNSDSKADKGNDINIDVNIDGTIDVNGDENNGEINGVSIVVNPTGADTNEANTKSTEKLTMSRSAYREGLDRAIGSDMHMVADYYTDFNHDGNFEMFALVTPHDENDVLEKRLYAHREESISFILGQIWFVNQDGARNISLTDSNDTSLENWAVLDIFTIGEDKFLLFIREGLFKDTVYLWGVTPSGEPYQTEISGYGSDILLNDYNEIELFYSTYNFYYDAETEGLIGRTWNPYYFYWDGMSFKEYGGILISIDSLYSICGSKELLEQIHTELKKTAEDVQIGEIYYRENGIININYQCKLKSSDDAYYNYNVTLRYENRKLKIIPGESDLLRKGLYLPVLIELIATFPESSFGIG